ncbi:hypothetical protein LIER_20161 [Lithospermum erythrorhizon]|uniref:Integrase catalytic domain-containing protein n=1 Tax=Lithospermum erythrorhizon TaxID=34254 RepID=A0AAV3QLK6_LITER
MWDYLQKMKSISDNLETSLYPITEAELVSHILFGLPSDYESIANSVYVETVISVNVASKTNEGYAPRQFRTKPTGGSYPSHRFSSKGKPDTNFSVSQLALDNNVFIEFHASHCFVKNFQGQILQTDWGGEFRNLSTLGINHRVSCPHTPEQNGAAERRHKNIVETGLTLFAAASMPLTYWDDAFATSVYLINRLPTKVLGYISPYQMSTSRSPTYSFLKVFGCRFFPYLKPYNKHKLQYRSIPCIFIGYSPQHKGYQCLHLPTGKVYISRHVVFDESIFPFTQDALSTNSSSLSSNSNSYSITPSSLVVLPHHDFPPDSLLPPPQLPNSSNPSQTINPMSVSIPSITPSPSPSNSPLLPKNPCPPSKHVPPPSHHMVIRTKTNSLKPRVF